MAMPSGRSDDCSTAGSEKSSAPGLPPRSAPANRRGPRPGVPSCKRRCVVAAADTLFGGLLAGTLILLFSYVADMVAEAAVCFELGFSKELIARGFVGEAWIFCPILAYVFVFIPGHRGFDVY